MKLRGNIWLVIAAWAIGAVIVAGGIFLLVGWAWYAWGFVGALLFLSAGSLAFAWVYDRRQSRRRGLAA